MSRNGNEFYLSLNSIGKKQTEQATSSHKGNDSYEQGNFLKTRIIEFG